MSATPGNTVTRAVVSFPALASPLTATLDVGSGSNRQVGVFVQSGSVDPSITSITVGTDTISLISNTSVTRGNLRTSIYGLTLSDANTGSVAVSVNFSNANGNLGFRALVVTDSDLINNGATTSSGTAVTISLGVTSPSGDLSATCICEDGAGSPTSSENRWSQENAAIVCAADYKTPVTDVDPTHTWTRIIDWTNACVSGVNFRASAGAPPPTDFAGPASPWIKVRLREY